MMMNRTIGYFDGIERGPLLVVLGAIHGNEPAGVKAMEYVLKMLEVEPITNQDFSYKGKIVGLIGNMQAYRSKQRFLNRDLNRSWRVEDVNRIRGTKKNLLIEEDLEIKELLGAIRRQINKYNPEHCIILDIHTTSSSGGIFSIPSKTPRSLALSKSLNAPVITGMLDGISGTIMHYFDDETLGVETDTLTFEAGQHEDPLSVNRAIAAIINIMKELKMIREEDVENIHNKILTDYSAGLPEHTHLEYTYQIRPDETFVMRPGYSNFDTIVEGEELATSDGKLVTAPKAGMILMPLYQRQGEDGFFIVEEVQR